jgi:hypothetical protein
LNSDEYVVQKFIDDSKHISEVVRFDLDRNELGDVAGKSLMHLQCHFGHDTLSWARRGAEAPGGGHAGLLVTIAGDRELVHFATKSH